MIKRILIVMLLLVATTSCAPKMPDSGEQICIPSSGSVQTDATGKPKEPLENIEKYLKDKKIITTLVTDIKSRLIGNGGFSSASSMYVGIATSPSFQMAIGAAFSLFVTIYGICVAAGLVQVTVGDAAIRIVKMAFVSIFAMSWGEFYNTVASFFINGTEQLMNYFMIAFKELNSTSSGSSGGGGGSGLFSITGGGAPALFNDLDIFVSRIFSPHTMALSSALMSSGEGNIPSMAFLVIALMYILMAIITIVQVYVMSLFALSLLFALAPIFLIFMLFKQTNTMFDNWLNQIISYSLQPVFVCAFVGLFLSLLAPTLQEFLQYKLCYQSTGEAGKGGIWTFWEPGASSATQYKANDAPPIDLQKIILFFVFSWLFGANIRFAVDLAGSIAPSFAADMSKNGALWKQVQEGRVGGGAGNLVNNMLGK